MLFVMSLSGFFLLLLLKTDVSAPAADKSVTEPLGYPAADTDEWYITTNTVRQDA